MDPNLAECRKREIPANWFFDYENIANPNHPLGRVPKECVDACKACSIRVECLDYALSFALNGYWGGTRKNARQKLRKTLGVRLLNQAEPPPWWQPDDD
jgi:hypothetical protein